MKIWTKFFLWLWALTSIGPAWYWYYNISEPVGVVLVSTANMGYGVTTMFLIQALYKGFTNPKAKR